ncbi:MAG: APC family permease [Bdellovibrionales bacterium]|nr:APC family permease [Bdellovibrionales bacterium]
MEPDKQKSELNWLIAAGVVGADIGTSVFYGTGILYPIVGYFAPLFVLTACLAMWIFKRTYEEGLAMSPYNGGAYSMILRSVGKQAAVFAGALTFVSYLATAAVSSLSGAFYLSSLFEGGLDQSTVVTISFIPVILFSLLNIKGIKEPAKIVTGIAICHFGLLILISIWGLGYILFHFSEIDFSKFGDFSAYPQTLTGATLAYGFAAAFLGITGFESAAQIVETLEQPTLLTVRKLYKVVIVMVSITAPVISIMCLTILTPEEVDSHIHHLLSGLSEKIGGRFLLTIIVIDATLTLFAATNTAFIGFIGLATTMAKNGNLPQICLKRLSHIIPSLEGYPVISLSFMAIVMFMSSMVAGEVDIAAKVYEVAFLGVMVSFAVGAILMRNKGFRKSTPTQYLSQTLIKFNNGIKIPLYPLLTSLILSFAIFLLVTHANSDVLFMLTFLIGITVVLMAYYRWGILENRLETHTDLRLGLGHFLHNVDELPENLPQHVLCIGEHRLRRLISKALNFISEKNPGPFELILFYAEEEESASNHGFYEVLQRVVSQQIAPIYKNKDIILTVKILPGNLLEGLRTLKESVTPKAIYFGIGRDPDHSYEIRKYIASEIEMPITTIH